MTANKNVDPNGAGAGVGVRREQCKELLSGFQEGCSSEEERGLESDFMKILSLVLGKIDVYK